LITITKLEGAWRFSSTCCLSRKKNKHLHCW